MQSRARGLLLVWRRELEQKLQINQYLPGHSRGVTLEIMVELDRRLGDWQRIFDHPNQDKSHAESIRT